MPHKERLLALINANNLSSLTLERVDFSAPAIDTDDNEASNTIVTITPKNGSGYQGAVTVHYQRPALSEVVTPTTLSSETPFTPELVITMLNEKRATYLDLADLEPITIPPLEVGDTAEIEITAKVDCFDWVGTTQVGLVYGLPANLDELNTLVQQTLPGAGYLN